MSKSSYTFVSQKGEEFFFPDIISIINHSGSGPEADCAASARGSRRRGAAKDQKRIVMRYDLVARFYTKAEDTKAAYACPLGIYYEIRLGNLENRGFGIDPESTPGFLDYLKRESSVEELKELTQKGYVSEVMDVLYAGEKEGGFARIEISAMEIEAIDDEGTIPPFGIFLGDTFVEFQFTEPESPVLFTVGDPYEATESTRRFTVLLGRLKEHYDVLTVYEVRACLRKDFGETEGLTYDELKRRLVELGVMEEKA